MKNKETLEEAAERYIDKHLKSNTGYTRTTIAKMFKDGAKWQQERSYSEEEVIEILSKSCDYIYASSKIGTDKKLMPNLLKGWFEQFKNK